MHTVVGVISQARRQRVLIVIVRCRNCDSSKYFTQCMEAPSTNFYVTA